MSHSRSCAGVSHDAYKWVTSHVSESCHAYAWVTSHINESWHKYEWVMSQMSKFTMPERLARIFRQISRVTYENVMAHMSGECPIWVSHGKYKWVMAQIWMSHVTYHIRMRTFKKIPRKKRGTSHQSDSAHTNESRDICNTAKKKSLPFIGTLVDSNTDTQTHIRTHRV